MIVASQMARRRALMNMDVNPNLELTVMQYIVLERVGRSRYHGEITQGQDSLQAVGEDAKSLFYLRKLLHKQRLITKQVRLGTIFGCMYTIDLSTVPVKIYLENEEYCTCVSWLQPS